MEQYISILKSNIKELGQFIGTLMSVWIGWKLNQVAQKKHDKKADSKELLNRLINIRSNCEALEYKIQKKAEDVIVKRFHLAYQLAYAECTGIIKSGKANECRLEYNEAIKQFEDILFQLKLFVAEYKSLTDSDETINQILQPLWEEKFELFQKLRDISNPEYFQIYMNDINESEPNDTVDKKRRQFNVMFDFLFKIMDQTIEFNLPYKRKIAKHTDRLIANGMNLEEEVRNDIAEIENE